MPGSLNGDPGEFAACPGVLPPAASISWQDWLGGPVPFGLPAYVAGTCRPMHPTTSSAANTFLMTFLLLGTRPGDTPWAWYLPLLTPHFLFPSRRPRALCT